MKKSNRALQRFAAGALAAAVLFTGAAAAGFTDTKTHWAKTYIEKLAAKGKIAGYEDGSFKPDAQVTTLETLVFVSRLATDASTPEDEIAREWNSVVTTAMKGASNWSYKNLAICLEAGILTESELTQLCAAGKMTQPATREELAVYLVRAMQLAPAAATLKSYPLVFSDSSSISPSAKPSVYLLYRSKIVDGMENNTFQPKGKVTRAQVATMMSRALDYMDQNGIVPEFADYTTYGYKSGTVISCTEDQGDVLLSLRNAKDEKMDFTVPGNARLYQDGVLVEPDQITVGGFARVCYQSSTSKTIGSVKALSAPVSVSGSILSLDMETLRLKDAAGATQDLRLDRFSQVYAGGVVGDRTIIDSKSGYQTATCITDGTGRVLSVRLSGGTYEQGGILVGLDGDNILVNDVTGMITRYPIPESANITVDGLRGSLSGKQIGRYVSIRVSADNGQVTDVDVDESTEYLQGVFESTSTTSGETTMKVTGLQDNKSYSYKLASGYRVYYNGEKVNISTLGKGSVVTLKLQNSKIIEVQASSGNYTAVGSLTSLKFGETIIAEITEDDGNVVILNMSPSRLPTVKRDDKTSSIEKLTSADTVTVTVKSGKVTLIEAKTKSTTVSGRVTNITLDANNGNHIYLTDKDGKSASYTLASGVVVTSGSARIDIMDVANGTVTLTIVNDLVTEVKLTSGAASSNELIGTVIFVNTTDKVILLETEDARVDGRVSVKLNSDTRMMDTVGNMVTLSGLDLGDQLQVFGSYKNGEFVASLIIRK